MGWGSGNAKRAISRRARPPANVRKSGPVLNRGLTLTIYNKTASWPYPLVVEYHSHDSVRMRILAILARIRSRATHLFRTDSRERDMRDEMQFHLDADVRDRIARGETPAEARRAALIAFGGVERFKEEAREARGVRALQDMAQDFRYAARMLNRSRTFSIAAIATLALGIASTTVVVSAVQAVFRSALPVVDSRQLYVMTEHGIASPSTEMARAVYPYLQYLAYRDAAQHVFDGVGGFRFDALSMRVGDDARVVSSVITSENYFTVLGVHPALGRFFTERRGGAELAEPEIVVGYDFWQREFHGDPRVLGRVVNIDSRPLAIVGVTPHDFHGTMLGVEADVWVPASVLRLPPPAAIASGDSTVLGPRYMPLTIFGRLREGWSVAQTESALSSIATVLPYDRGHTEPRGVKATLESLDGVPQQARKQTIGFMTMLVLTAAFVLLIAATNVAAMLVARALHRQREVAVRLALGASRGRLVRQLLTESLLLCALAVTAGMLLARWLIALAPLLAPEMSIRIVLTPKLDWAVMSVVVVVALVTGVLAGLAPALNATRPQLLPALHGTTQLSRKSQLRNAFVIMQLALSVVLLFSAGLFARAMQRSLAIDTGMDVTGVAIATLNLAPHGYAGARSTLFFEQLLQRLRARPEVVSVAVGNSMPLSGNNNGGNIQRPGAGPTEWKPSSMSGTASASWFATMHVPIIAGRNFGANDVTGAPLVALVNEALARDIWPHENPIGKTLRFNFVNREVIGVVRDGKYRSLDEKSQSYLWLPAAQRPVAAMTVYARARSNSTADVNAASRAIRDEARALDANVALSDVGTVERQMEIARLPQLIAAWLIGAFGVIGLGIAAIGVYGVIAYHVAQRTREFGIRIALGATAAQVMREIMRHTFRLVGIAVVLGLVAAMGVGRIASGFLFGVSAGDPVTAAGVAVLLVVVAGVAAWVPARRVGGAEAMAVLRAE